MKVLIAGYGVVGSNLEKDIVRANPDIYDKYKNIDKRKHDKYDITFICVDTPLNIVDNTLYIDEVINVVNEQNSELYVIKSTVNIGDTTKIKNLTGKRVVFSPEYYGATQHANAHPYTFTIVGADDEKDGYDVVQLLQNVYDAYHTFRVVDTKTAETVKFMENSWLAYKVSFMTQFYELSKRIGVNYEELRELFLLDPRVNPSHTFVYKKHPYWSSHCFDKDVPAIAFPYNLELIKNMIKFNDEQKKNYKK